MRPGRAPPIRPIKAHRGVEQRFQSEPLRQRGDEQQTGVSDQVRVVEGDVDAVDAVRYSGHWKCLLAWSTKTTLNTVIVPAQEAFLVDTRGASTRPNRWIKAKHDIVRPLHTPGSDGPQVRRRPFRPTAQPLWTGDTKDHRGYGPSNRQTTAPTGSTTSALDAGACPGHASVARPSKTTAHSSCRCQPADVVHTDLNAQNDAPERQPITSSDPPRTASRSRRRLPGLRETGVSSSVVAHRPTMADHRLRASSTARTLSRPSPG